MSEISKLVSCAMADTSNVCDDVKLGRFPNFLAQSIAAKTGVRLHGVEIILTAYSIRHIIKGHSVHTEELEKRGQIGVVNSDFDLIPEILQKADFIIKGSIERGKQSILFIKKIKCFYHVAMILEGKKDEVKLVLRTMYKSNVNKKADV